MITTLIVIYGFLLLATLATAGWVGFDAWENGRKSEGYGFYGDLLFVGMLLAMAALFACTLMVLAR